MSAPVPKISFKFGVIVVLIIGSIVIAESLYNKSKDEIDNLNFKLDGNENITFSYANKYSSVISYDKQGSAVNMMLRLTRYPNDYQIEINVEKNKNRRNKEYIKTLNPNAPLAIAKGFTRLNICPYFQIISEEEIKAKSDYKFKINCKNLENL